MRYSALTAAMILVMLGVAVYAAHRDSEEKLQLERVKSEERIRIIEAFARENLKPES